MLDFEKIAQDAYHDEMDKIAGGKASKALDALRKSFKNIKPNVKEAFRVRRSSKKYLKNVKTNSAADFDILKSISNKGDRAHYKDLARQIAPALGALGVGAGAVAGGGYALSRD